MEYLSSLVVQDFVHQQYDWMFFGDESHDAIRKKSPSLRILGTSKGLKLYSRGV